MTNKVFGILFIIYYILLQFYCETTEILDENSLKLSNVSESVKKHRLYQQIKKLCEITRKVVDERINYITAVENCLSKPVSVRLKICSEWIYIACTVVIII